jgi:hypothetical protein
VGSPPPLEPISKAACEVLGLEDPIVWTGLKAIESILGEGVVTLEDSNDNYANGRIYVSEAIDEYDSVYGPPVNFLGYGSERDGAYTREARIRIVGLNPNTRQLGFHIAIAAHEATHAWLQKNAPDHYHNEMLTNDLAAKWLKGKLAGFQLHAALDMNEISKASYRPEYDERAKRDARPKHPWENPDENRNWDSYTCDPLYRAAFDVEYDAYKAKVKAFNDAYDANPTAFDAKTWAIDYDLRSNTK